MKPHTLLCSAVALFTLSACVVGPPYQRPVRPIVGGPVIRPLPSNRPVFHRPPSGRPVVGRPIMLPPGASPYTYHGVRYHSHRGVWYRPHAGGYIIVPRPY